MMRFLIPGFICSNSSSFKEVRDFSAARHLLFKDYPAAKAAMVEADRERFSAQANAFEAGLPSAHVVRLPNASHYVFKSNEADGIREMNAFLSKLP
ncbi:MAG: putative hydrolase [Edaphobacter sp.]|nr:putative hydrolase [Edaphobacter sp.]